MIALNGNSIGAKASGSAGGLAGTGSFLGQERRFLTSLAPAAIVTLGLFAAMIQLIRVEEVELPEVVQRPLSTITPQSEPSEPVRIDRKPAAPLNVELPPMPPVSKLDTGVSGLPAPVIQPGNWTLQRETVRFAPPAPQAMGERIAQAIRPPVASYPRSMASKGLEGTCDVHFSLSTRGLPYDVTASCSHAGFEKEAVRAVSRAEFLPEIRQGVPVESHNYVYPMEFRLQ
jgi:protein TonB